MLLEHIRPLRHAKCSHPHAEPQTHRGSLVSQATNAARIQGCIRSSEFAIRVGITLVDVEEVVAVALQILRKPLGVGECRAPCEAVVVSRPAPPSPRSRLGDARIAKHADCASITLKLRMVVFADGEHHLLGRNRFTGLHRKAEFDLLIGGAFPD